MKTEVSLPCSRVHQRTISRARWISPHPHIFTYCTCKINFNIFHPPTSTSPKWRIRCSCSDYSYICMYMRVFLSFEDVVLIHSVGFKGCYSLFRFVLLDKKQSILVVWNMKSPAVQFTGISSEFICLESN